MKDKLLSFIEFYGYNDVVFLGKNAKGDYLFEASFMGNNYTLKIVIEGETVKLYEYKHREDQDEMRSGNIFTLESTFTIDEMEEVI